MRWPIEKPAEPEWHRWFAWKPISVGNQTVWLEWVDRKAKYYHGGAGDCVVEWEYALLECCY